MEYGIGDTIYVSGKFVGVVCEVKNNTVVTKCNDGAKHEVKYTEVELIAKAADVIDQMKGAINYAYHNSKA